MPHSPYRDRVIPPSVPQLRVIATGTLLAVLLSLTACTSTADPTPTPTATPLFPSKKEAFAAAEATFEQYTDATNATDLTDTHTFDGVFYWLADSAESTARKNYSGYYAAGITRSGESKFDSFQPVSSEGDTVTARVCLDVSAVSLTNPDGTSAVPVDRPPRQPVQVLFVPASTQTGLAISSITTSVADTCER